MKPRLRKYKGMWNCAGRGKRAADVCPRMAYFKWLHLEMFGWSGGNV